MSLKNICKVIMALALSLPQGMAVAAGEITAISGSHVRRAYQKMVTTKKRLLSVSSDQEFIELLGESLTTKEKDFFTTLLNEARKEKGLTGVSIKSLLATMQFQIASDGKLTIFQSGSRLATLEIVDFANRLLRVNGRSYVYRPYTSPITLYREMEEMIGSQVSTRQGSRSAVLLLFGSTSAQAAVHVIFKVIAGYIASAFAASAFVCPRVTETRDDRDFCDFAWPVTLGGMTAKGIWNLQRDSEIARKGPLEVNINKVECKRSARPAERTVDSYGVPLNLRADPGVLMTFARFTIPKAELSGIMEIRSDAAPPVVVFNFDDESNNKGIKSTTVTIPFDQLNSGKASDVTGPLASSSEKNALHNVNFTKDLIEICKDSERLAKVNAVLGTNEAGVTPSALKNAVK